jgi:hypothetical protein
MFAAFDAATIAVLKAPGSVQRTLKKTSVFRVLVRITVADSLPRAVLDTSLHSISQVDVEYSQPWFFIVGGRG